MAFHLVVLLAFRPGCAAALHHALSLPCTPLLPDTTVLHLCSCPAFIALNAAQVVGGINALLEGMDWLYSSAVPVDCLLVTMGGSPVNPKEAYVLRFRHEAGAAAAAATHGDSLDVLRRMMRAMMGSKMEQWDAQTPKGKLFVLARVEGASGARWEDGGWVPKTGYEPRFGRCRPIEVRVGPEVAAGGEEDVWSAAGKPSQGFLWLQCGPCGVRGMPQAELGGN